MATDLQLKMVLRAVDKATAPVRRVTTAVRRLGKAQARDSAGRFTKRQSLGFAQIGKNATLAGQSVSRLGSEVGRLGLKVAAVAGVGAYLFKSQFVDTAAEFERFRAVLTTVEGDSVKAQRSLDWVNDFAAETPFQLAEVTDAFVKMRAYGLDPTNGLLRTLGDTASAMNKPVMQAVEAIADATTGEFERLKEFGVKAAVKGEQAKFTFTDKMGKQQMRVVNKNSRAQIQATLAAIWNEKYQGAMQRQSKTWDGLVSNIGDQWTRFKNMVMAAGLFDFLKTRLQEVLKWVDKMASSGKLEQWAKRVSNAIMGVVQGLWDNRKAIKDTVTTWIDRIQAVVEFVGGWKNALLLLGAVMMRKTIYATGQFVVSVARLTASLYRSAAAAYANSPALQAFARALYRGAAVALKFAVTTGVRAVRAVARMAVTLVTRGIPALLRFAVSMGTTAVAAIGSFATAAWSTAIPALTAFAAKTWALVAAGAAAAAPFVAIAAAIGAVTLAIRQLMKYWDELDFGEVLQGISDVFSEDGLLSTIGQLFDPRALINSVSEDLDSLFGGDNEQAATGGGSGQPVKHLSARQRTDVGGSLKVEVEGVQGAKARVKEIRQNGPMRLDVGTGWTMAEAG